MTFSFNPTSTQVIAPGAGAQETVFPAVSAVPAAVAETPEISVEE